LRSLIVFEPPPFILHSSAMTTVATAARVPAVAIAAAKNSFVRLKCVNTWHQTTTSTTTTTSKKKKKQMNRRIREEETKALSTRRRPWCTRTFQQRRNRERNRRGAWHQLANDDQLNMHKKNFYLSSATHRERAYVFLHVLKFVSHSLPELLLVLSEKNKRKGW